MKISVTVSVYESNNEQIETYPNPVKDVAIFSTVEITLSEIYNMKGSLIMRQIGNKVDMSSFNSGIYFVVGFDKNLNPLYKGKVIKN